MADLWIESHDNLRDHPKLKRLARSLGISKPQAIGHLHCLWWWCLTYAQDGDLSACAPEDIADAAMWEGDPDKFVRALTVDTAGCSASGAGFVDADMRVHDWEEFGEKLLRKRRANAERMRTAREERDRQAGKAHVASTPDTRALHVQRTCSACAPATGQDRTGQDTTGQKTPPDADASAPPGGTESEATGKRPVTSKGPTRRNLVANPPTVEEVDAELSRWPSRAHLAGTSWPQRFIDANAAVGWRYGRGVGKPVVDWRAHCRQWADRDQEGHDQRRAERNGDGGPPGRPAYETPEERATRLALERVRAEGYTDED